jgi:CheY-like chemotaxis protein
LESKGHFVTCAETAAVAREVSARENFELLISDLGLPDGNGMELCRDLRQRQPSLVAIAISGYGLPHDALTCKEAGFSEHLLKPINIRELDTALASVVDQIKNGRSIAEVFGREIFGKKVE